MSSSGIGQFIPLILIFVIFYFFLIRPQQKKAKDFTTKLLHWRQSATAIHNGKLMHFIPKDGIYVYFRYNDDQKVMIIFNKNQNTNNTKGDLK